MTVLEQKKRFDRNREELHAIAKEFAQKVKDNPYVWGIVAKPYGAYMHLITLIDWQIPNHLQKRRGRCQAREFTECRLNRMND